MGMVTRNGVLEMIVVELSILVVDVGWQKWGLGQRLLLYCELFFITFDITPRRPVLEWLQGVKFWSSNNYNVSILYIYNQKLKKI